METYEVRIARLLSDREQQYEQMNKYLIDARHEKWETQVWHS